MNKFVGFLLPFKLFAVVICLFTRGWHGSLHQSAGNVSKASEKIATMMVRLLALSQERVAIYEHSLSGDYNNRLPCERKPPVPSW
jgi:hypothetical protein